MKPASIDPMACLLVATLPAGDEWLYEIKWDGYRAIGRNRTAELRFFVFDLLAVDGKDLRGLPLTKRRPALEKILPGGESVIRLSLQSPKNGQEVHKQKKLP